ncbi:hypothetical protein [Planctomicrobium sp. SH664]|uniref:hypothetical protein n=1 Tax=Planctomicrobium sp. SH664 TaxID=3448125 RepID=UPI003F5BD72F
MWAIHRIRLQGPWEVTPPGAASDHWETLQIPATWEEAFGERRGPVTFRRRFNAPTGLEDGDRLFIRLPEDCGSVQRLSLNEEERSAGAEELWQFDVTEAIRPFNLLQFTLAGESDARGLWAPVQLEIHTRK